MVDTVTRSVEACKNAVFDAARAGFEKELVNTWAESYESLKINQNQTEFKVGFIGRTGVGKSQALNAILGEHDVFPVTISSACTATVVEALYHAKDGIYEALVQFITEVSKAYLKAFDGKASHESHEWCTANFC